VSQKGKESSACKSYSIFCTGIALRKVEERRQAKDESAKAGANGGEGGNQTDVASILARRVAVEMSDSEDGGQGGSAHAASDSEYDSDDWGDESQA